MNNKTLQTAEEKDETIIEITEHKEESEFKQTNESNRTVKKVKEKQNVAGTIQDEMCDQRTVCFSQNCCKLGIEAKEAACNKIVNINNKTLQRIDEKD